MSKENRKRDKGVVGKSKSVHQVLDIPCFVVKSEDDPLIWVDKYLGSSKGRYKGSDRMTRSWG